MDVQKKALRGIIQNVTRLMDHTISIEEAMADTTALAAHDFADADQPRIAEYLGEIARQHRIRAMHMGGQQAALRAEYAFLL